MKRKTPETEQKIPKMNRHEIKKMSSRDTSPQIMKRNESHIVAILINMMCRNEDALFDAYKKFITTNTREIRDFVWFYLVISAIRNKMFFFASFLVEERKLDLTALDNLRHEYEYYHEHEDYMTSIYFMTLLCHYVRGDEKEFDDFINSARTYGKTAILCHIVKNSFLIDFHKIFQWWFVNPCKRNVVIICNLLREFNVGLDDGIIGHGDNFKQMRGSLMRTIINNSMSFLGVPSTSIVMECSITVVEILGDRCPDFHLTENDLKKACDPIITKIIEVKNADIIDLIRNLLPMPIAEEIEPHIRTLT